MPGCETTYLGRLGQLMFAVCTPRSVPLCLWDTLIFLRVLHSYVFAFLRQYKIKMIPRYTIHYILYHTEYTLCVDHIYIYI